jgi:hypothetical protein
LSSSDLICGYTQSLNESIHRLVQAGSLAAQGVSLLVASAGLLSILLTTESTVKSATFFSDVAILYPFAFWAVIKIGDCVADVDI